MRRILCALLALLLLLGIPTAGFAAEAGTVEEVYSATGDYLVSLGAPSAGGLGGEWMALGLVRSGRQVPQSYYESVLAYVQENIGEDGRLHQTKSTSNSRFIVALTAIGEDATNVGGHDLLAGLNDMAYIRKVGVSGVFWALIAFDCGNYGTPEGITREALVAEILDEQLPDGGWAVSGQEADPDMTAMGIQALAPYMEEEAVAAAVEAALGVLSRMQDETGNFPSKYGSSSESVSQVIVALCTLGIDPNTDERFVKEGVSALDALLSYCVEGGGFRHIMDGKRDGMATEQGYYALCAYFRMLQGQTPLYDMSDAVPDKADAAPDKTDAAPEQTPSEPTETGETNAPSWLWIVLGTGAALAIVLLIFKKKLGKKTFGNALMVLIIALIAGVGVGFALQMGVFRQQAGLGSEYEIREIPGNRLVTSEAAENTCTITIRCDTVLANQSLLDEAKAPYVPTDGTILPEITVEFTPGESVFEVLQRVCDAAEIPLEYSWTPLYDAYYLEGINHLYEFDCGSESGWMYQVNGTFPNYGCSSYEVKPGDRIQWLYTCIGLGADLGAEIMEG